MAIIRLPLHDACLQTERMCSSCTMKIKEGRVLDWEVELLKVLLKISKMLRVEGEYVYKSSTIIGSTLYIILEGNRIEGLEDLLRENLNLRGVSRIRVLYYNGRLEDLLEKIYGQRILGVSRVYTADGTTTLIVKVEKEDIGAEKLASALLKTRIITQTEKPLKQYTTKKKRQLDIKKILEEIT